MTLTNDEINTIALNMINCSNCHRTKKLGKAILKSSISKIKYLYSIFSFEFMVYSEPFIKN